MRNSIGNLFRDRRGFSLTSAFFCALTAMLLTSTVVSNHKNTRIVLAILTNICASVTYFTDKKRISQKLFDVTVEKHSNAVRAAEMVYGERSSLNISFGTKAPEKQGISGTIEKFFRDRDYLVTVIAEKRAPSFTRFVLELGSNSNGKLLEPSDIKKFLPGLQIQLNMENQPWVGVDKDGLHLDIPNDKRDVFEILSHCLDIQPDPTVPSMLFGVDTNLKPVYRKFSELSHLLIAGETNAGKTSSTLASLYWSLYWYSPDILNIWPYDSQKGLSFPIKPKHFPHFTRELTHTHEDCIRLLQDFATEADRREKLLVSCNVSSWIEYQKLSEKPEKLPYLVAWLEEMLPILMDKKYNKQLFTLMIALLAKVRKLGMAIVTVIQTPSKRGLPDEFGVVRDNIPTILVYRLDTSIGRTLLGESNVIPTKSLLGAGDSLIQVPGVTGIVRLQGYYISEQSYNVAIQNINSKWGGNSDILETQPKPDKLPASVALSPELTPVERGRILETWRDFERLGKIPSKEIFVTSIYQVTKGSAYQPWLNACEKVARVLDNAGIKYPSNWFKK